MTNLRRAIKYLPRIIYSVYFKKEIDDKMMHIALTEPFNLSFFFFIEYPLIFLPSLLYRLSLKGTALLWSPLLWIVRRTDELHDWVHMISKAALYRVMRIYSLIIIGMFVAKVYVYASWNELAAVWNNIPGVVLLNAYIEPQSIPVWQLAALLNAVSAWLVYFVADWYWNRYKLKDKVPEIALYRSLRTVTIVRDVLSLYTISCSIYITLFLYTGFKWPPLGTKMFPWQ